MPFKPGQSGNKKGRPPGRPDRRRALADALGARSQELLDVAIEKALAGDGAVLIALLGRLIAPARPSRVPIKLRVKRNATASDIAEAVAAAAIAGEIPSDVAAEIVSTVASIARLRGEGNDDAAAEPVQINRRTIDASKESFAERAPGDPK